MLERIGSCCSAHRWAVVFGWAAALVIVWVVAIVLGGQALNDFTLPGAQSQEAQDRLDDSFPQEAGTSATIVYQTKGSGVTVETAAVTSAIEESLSEISSQTDIESVTSPYDDPSEISPDQTTALASIQYSKAAPDLPDEGVTAFDDLVDVADKFSSSDLEIQVGGDLAQSQGTPLNAGVVLIGLLAALIILLIALGTWTSFAWPVIGALTGVTFGVGLVHIVEAFLTVPSIASTGAVMVGLGVGIDYGLFIVSRFKDAITEGAEPSEAARRVLDSTGRAVLTAGSTVAIALIALVVFQVPAVSAIAIAIILVVIPVVGVALTLQPAIMALFGERLAKAALPWARRERRAPWGLSWTKFVTRMPALWLCLGIVVLLVLAIPVFAGSLRLGPDNLELFPTDSTEYKAYELETAAFGPGSADPFLIVVEIPSGDTDAPAQIQQLEEDIAATSGVADATTAQTNSSGNTAVFEVIPSTSAQSAATATLVGTMRDDTIPKAIQGTGLTVLVGGTNALFVDLDNQITSRLIWFILLVVAIALVILASVFRSLLIPIKAALFNVLVIFATYGVYTAVFTYGWGRSLIGVPSNVPLLSLLAPVIFAVLFGLSNDYEVYLVERMREEHDRTHDARRAVRLGHGAGSRVVIAAALIMTSVFASYAFQPGTSIKEFGFAMAVAILLDAFIARMIMLPAAMYMGGERMWWMPHWLDRILPSLASGSRSDEETPDAEPATVTN